MEKIWAASSSAISTAVVHDAELLARSAVPPYDRDRVRGNKGMFKTLERWSPEILSLTRIAFGITFVEHGTQKLFSFPLEPVGGLPPGMLLFVGLLETICGALVALGLFTRLAAFLLSGEMANVISTWRQQVTTDGATETRQTNRAIDVLTRGEDCQWRITRSLNYPLVQPS